MPIRVQPSEFEVSEDPNGDPFDNDSLDREDAIRELTTLLTNIEGPCVMAVDASWGKGKTTFRRMWAQFLRNQGFPVVDFNAWETDFTWDPFFALWSEVSVQLATQEGDDDSPGRLPILARQIMPHLRSGTNLAAMGFALAGVPELAAMSAAVSDTVGELQSIAGKPDSDPTVEDEPPFLEATYLEAKDLLREFRLMLNQSARSLAEAHKGLPLIVTIDELDRCRPTYAIELLETAKHIFSVDHVVFVLCLDRKQLAHSVKAVYGRKFDAEGYLRRFFDIDYQLPDPDRREFVNSLLDSLEINKHLEASRFIRHLEPFDVELLPSILDQDTLSLRDLQQMIHRLAVMLATGSSTREIHADILALLLVIRTANRSLYARMVAGVATDDEVIKALSQSDLSQKSHGASIEALASACVGHCAYLANGELDWTELPHAMMRLDDYNDNYANRYLRPDSNYGRSQQQQEQERSAEHLGQVIQRQRGEIRSMEFLSDFVNHLNDFYSMRTNDKWSLLGTRNTRTTQKCLELLELFPDPAAT